MEQVLSYIENGSAQLNRLLWGWPLMLLLLGCGLYLSRGTGFLQLRRFPHILGYSLRQIFADPSAAGEVSPFQALSTSLAATIGTGNIAGVAGALALGGPGAIFWMWVSSLLGMATKYAEVLLSIKYRQRNAAGDWVGGPMYYIQKGLGRKWRPLAVLFCLCCIAASLGIGNMAQVNTMSENITLAVQLFAPTVSETSIRLLVGLFSAGVVGLILLGGVKRLGQVTELLVPIMSLLYILAALWVILRNSRAILPALQSIVLGAFCPRAVLGAGAGIGLSTALKSGIARGIFTHEAGLGSAPIAHAASSEKDPARQGFYGIFEVFLDTMVLCTLTALAILCSGVSIPYGSVAGAALATQAFASVFEPRLSTLVVAAALSLFALSTICSWSLYGLRCWEYLFGEGSATVYRLLYLLMLLPGACMDLGLVWRISENLNALMAIPNLAALLALSPAVFRETRRYFDKI